MTITPTRLPGPVAALARAATRVGDALVLAAKSPSVVIAISACAAGMMITLGTTSAIG
jgi:hypothetical protein